MSAEDIVDSEFSTVRRNDTLSAVRTALHGFTVFVNFYFLNLLYD